MTLKREWFLDCLPDIIKVMPTLLTIAANNQGRYASHMVKMLLDRVSDIKVTPALLEIAMANTGYCRAKIVRKLLRRTPDLQCNNPDELTPTADEN